MLSQVFWQECLIETPESVWVLFPRFDLLELGSLKTRELCKLGRLKCTKLYKAHAEKKNLGYTELMINDIHVYEQRHACLRTGWVTAARTSYQVSHFDGYEQFSPVMITAGPLISSP